MDDFSQNTLEELRRYDTRLESMIRLFFPPLSPGCEEDCDALEAVCSHWSRVLLTLPGDAREMLLRKARGMTPEQIAADLGLSVEAVLQWEKTVSGKLWDTRKHASVRRRIRIRNFYSADLFEEILAGFQTSANGKRPVITHEAFCAAADSRQFSETGRRDLAEFLIGQGCVILEPDGELRLVLREEPPLEGQPRRVRSRLAEEAKWDLLLKLLTRWYSKTPAEEFQRLHQARFRKALARDPFLETLFSENCRELDTAVLARKLGAEPEKVLEGRKEIWRLHRASFPVL